MPESASNEPRRWFGRYELLFRFASGGMADLFLARLVGEEGFERPVAVKLIHEHLGREEQFIKMFIDEARLASRISHPNVVLTLDLGRVESRYFIAMEYVEGESLAALLRRTRPPVHHAARIVSDAAAGLHAAHELRDGKGELLHVVHRDVSPQNILVSYEGAVKVADFGVARARGSLHTTTGEIKGKFSYMSPEQFTAPTTLDRRSDIFSLGIVLYEATTRRRLFKTPTEAETMERVLRSKITPPSQLVPGYPRPLEQIVLRALRRDPSKRFQTAQEMHDELERFIMSAGEPVSSMTIATLMRGIFADHIQTKRELRERPVNASDHTVSVVELVSGSSVQAEPSVEPYIPPRRRWPAAVAVLALVAVAGLAVGFLVLNGSSRRASGGTPTPPDARPVAARPPDASPAPRPDTRRTVTIAARAQPSSAKILLDGKPMSNPFEIERPLGEGFAELEISAPRHTPQRFRVPLAKGGTWSVVLAPAPRKKKPPQGKRRYLDNPYQ
jgi:serine/threonine protein kinase